MPLARHTTGMLLSLALLVAGCGNGGNNGSEAVPEPPPPTSPEPPEPPEDPPPDPPEEPEPPAPTIGLDARPSNTTCIAPTRATGSTTIGTERAFPNLTFRDPVTRVSRNPVLLLQAPRDASRWFVVERFGAVRVFDNDPAVAASSIFLDLGSHIESSCSECGLLGMAFHPDFPATPRVYLVYTSLQRTQAGPDTHLSEFSSSDGGLTLGPNSERIVLTIAKRSVHHHGGHIGFGPDGFLYFGAGDGNAGSRNDAQDPRTLLGKMVRIDIRGTTGSALYRIPADNPFAASTALCNVNGSGPQNCPEIYAIGFRNPWRWSFDRQTHDIWLGDVGEGLLEEVDRVVRGGNYGWKCFEGTQDRGVNCGSPANLLPPIAQYSHSVGNVITGGYVYRGTAVPGLVGRYIFTDFGSGRVWHIANDTAPTMTMTDGFDSGLNISSFAEDPDGELYAVNMRGTLHRITGSGAGTGVATSLSATGCVDPTNPMLPARGLIPYSPHESDRNCGHARRASACIPAHQLFAVPSPRWPDDVQHGFALRDYAREYQRLRRRTRTW